MIKLNKLPSIFPSHQGEEKVGHWSKSRYIGMRRKVPEYVKDIAKELKLKIRTTYARV